jgi:hypothetical protein
MNYIKRIYELRKLTKYISLYENVNLKNLYKGVGRVPGEFNKELLEFLKLTNGASILDYCFLGIKNMKLGTNLDKFYLELWSNNNQLAGRIIPFISSSVGDNFGYLIGEHRNGEIVYYNNEYTDRMWVIGSSFNIFMTTFLDDVEHTINNAEDELILTVEIPNWPIDTEHWIKRDSVLLKTYNNLGIENDGVIYL